MCYDNDTDNLSIRVSLLANITEQLEQHGRVYVSQTINTTARAWILTRLTTSPLMKQSGVLVVTEDEAADRAWRLQLAFWLQTNPTRRRIVHFSNEPVAFLYDLLMRAPNIFIIKRTDWKQSLPATKYLEDSILHLQVNTQYSPAKLLATLVKMGFARQTKVFAKGEFAKRGHVIDIYIDKSPVRIIYEDNHISELYEFDSLTQKKTKPLISVDVIPITLPAYQTGNLTDYLNDDLLITLTDTIPEYTHLNKGRLLIWQTFGHEHSTTAGFDNLPKWSGDLKAYQAFMKDKTDWQLILATTITTLKKSSATLLTPVTGIEGFMNQAEKIICVTDTELSAAPRVTTTNKEHLLLTDIKPGDYVVHIDHGIARFAGITKQVIDSETRESFELHYDQGDKLFVPVDRADRISKYVGLSRPTLHRLSSTQWESLRSRVKKDLLKDAQKLLDIYARRELASVEPLEIDQHTLEQISRDFPFAETPDQLHAWEEIKHDLTLRTPMDRLVCGDVGFGKTEVALRTAALLALNNRQVAILCPTTLLAQQHFDTFSERLNKYGFSVALLSRFNSPAEQTKNLKQIAQGQIDIIIGTHRLLSEDVSFTNLGLMIIDEEQRFGVTHKERLKKIRPNIHVLTLSATPIPRTLNFSLAGLKPVSLIMTPPVDRKPIRTYILKYDQEKIKTVLEQELKRKGQAYYLYNQVETIGLKARELQRLLPRARLGIAHGQLPARELAQIMHKFDTKKIDILICSTIIENGIDLPNVNTLIVEQAPRFGLSELYQLRGRVGRSTTQAYAYFFYGSEKLTGQAKKRLQTLEAATELGDGFKIARRDLEIRGIGNILGKEQHGEIKAIGLNLYLELLKQTLTELKTGTKTEIEAAIAIDLPLTYTIPDTMVTDQEQKFRLYQQLAVLKTARELDAYVEKKFGNKKLPEEFKNLIEILKIKLLCKAADISGIDTVQKRNLFLYFKDEIDYHKVSQLLNYNSHWLLKDKKLKITLDDMGKDWLDILKKSLLILKK